MFGLHRAALQPQLSKYLQRRVGVEISVLWAGKLRHGPTGRVIHPRVTPRASTETGTAAQIRSPLLCIKSSACSKAVLRLSVPLLPSPAPLNSFGQGCLAWLVRRQLQQPRESARERADKYKYSSLCVPGRREREDGWDGFLAAYNLGGIFRRKLSVGPLASWILLQNQPQQGLGVEGSCPVLSTSLCITDDVMRGQGGP